MTNLSKLATAVLILTISNNIYSMEDNVLNTPVNYENIEDEAQILQDSHDNEIEEEKDHNILRLRNKFCNIPYYITDVFKYDTEKHYSTIEQNMYYVITDKEQLQLIFNSNDQYIIDEMNQAFSVIFNIKTPKENNIWSIPFGIPITKAIYFNNNNNNISYNLAKKCIQEIEYTRTNLFNILEYINTNKPILLTKQGGQLLYNNLTKFLNIMINSLLSHNIQKIEKFYTQQKHVILETAKPELTKFITKLDNFTKIANQIRKVQILRDIQSLHAKKLRIQDAQDNNYIHNIDSEIHFKSLELAQLENQENWNDTNDITKNEATKKLDIEIKDLKLQLEQNGYIVNNNEISLDKCISYSQRLHFTMLSDTIEFFDSFLLDNDVLYAMLAYSNKEDMIKLLYKIFSNRYIKNYFDNYHFTIAKIKQIFNNVLEINSALINSQKSDEWYTFMFVNDLNDSILKNFQTKYFKNKINIASKEIINLFDTIIKSVSESKLDPNFKDEFCYNILGLEKNNLKIGIDREIKLLESTPMFFYYKYNKDLMMTMK